MATRKTHVLSDETGQQMLSALEDIAEALNGSGSEQYANLDEIQFPMDEEQGDAEPEQEQQDATIRSEI